MSDDESATTNTEAGNEHRLKSKKERREGRADPQDIGNNFRFRYSSSTWQ
jgi:hypothetical protein